MQWIRCWIAEIAGKPYSGLTLSQAAALKKTVARKQALRQKMNEMEITHSYDEFPGGRTYDYWGRSLAKHVEFFSKYLAIGK